MSLRNEAIDHIQSEIERVGVDQLDRGAIVKAFIAKGASRARIYDWLKVEIANARTPPAAPGDLEADVTAAEEAMDRASTIRALPSKDQVTALRREASAAIKDARSSASVPDSPPVVADSRPIDETSSGIMTVPVVAAVPSRGIGLVMSKIERAINVVDQCIDYSYGANGQLRNPRMALAASDGLRRCLETALKLHEAVDNVQALQRFMDEIMAALREVSPEVAAVVVARLQGVTGRWAA